MISLPESDREGALFFANDGQPLLTLDDWRACHPERHWAVGRSAMLLAQAWHEAQAWPPAVEAALKAVPELSELRVERGVAEHKTRVPGRGKASVTDLMIFASTERGVPIVVGVEGKVDESFGPLVKDWLDVRAPASVANRRVRLTGLCVELELDVQSPSLRSIRYQLLHRTFSAIATARATGAGTAVLLVHSFDVSGAGRGDFARFAQMLGCSRRGAAHTRMLGALRLYLVWVADEGGNGVYASTRREG